jgi:hypothetical protein
MATVTTTVKASSLNVDNRAKLKILGRGGSTITLPITTPSATYSNLESNWQEVPRPGQLPLNIKVGYKLSTVEITVQIVPPDGGILDPGNTVQTIITQLIDMANNDAVDKPIAFTWGILDSSTALTNTGHWHIETMEIVSNTRQPGTNNITQATASITLKQAAN